MQDPFRRMESKTGAEESNDFTTKAAERMSMEEIEEGLFAGAVEADLTVAADSIGRNRADSITADMEKVGAGQQMKAEDGAGTAEGGTKTKGEGTGTYGARRDKVG